MEVDPDMAVGKTAEVEESTASFMSATSSMRSTTLLPTSCLSVPDGIGLSGGSEFDAIGHTGGGGSGSVATTTVAGAAAGSSGGLYQHNSSSNNRLTQSLSQGLSHPRVEQQPSVAQSRAKGVKTNNTNTSMQRQVPLHGGGGGGQGKGRHFHHHHNQQLYSQQSQQHVHQAGGNGWLSGSTGNLALHSQQQKHDKSHAAARSSRRFRKYGYYGSSSIAGNGRHRDNNDDDPHHHTADHAAAATGHGGHFGKRFGAKLRNLISNSSNNKGRDRDRNGGDELPDKVVGDGDVSGKVQKDVAAVDDDCGGGLDANGVE